MTENNNNNNPYRSKISSDDDTDEDSRRVTNLFLTSGSFHTALENVRAYVDGELQEGDARTQAGLLLSKVEQIHGNCGANDIMCEINKAASAGLFEQILDQILPKKRKPVLENKAFHHDARYVLLERAPLCEKLVDAVLKLDPSALTREQADRLSNVLDNLPYLRLDEESRVFHSIIPQDSQHSRQTCAKVPISRTGPLGLDYKNFYLGCRADNLADATNLPMATSKLKL
jgi:hypothetical protein